MCHILVCMNVGVVNSLVVMHVMTIVIANINMLHASFYGSSCDLTKCPLSVTIDRKR